MRIIFFGDSITQGFFDNRGGWVARIASKYHGEALKNLNGDWLEVFNLGVSGDTIDNVLDRVKDETDKRRRKNDQMIVVIAVGINDSLLINNRVFKDEYKFQEQYEKLVDIVTQISDKCMFIGLSAVDEKLVNPYGSSSTGKQYLNNRINLFEDCIKQACEIKHVPFVPVHDMFIGQLGEKHALLADGLHPDEAGHSLLYEIILPELEALVG
ncbi:SGNH/GDSL hydrolase family protein [soil metagenome]